MISKIFLFAVLFNSYSVNFAMLLKMPCAKIINTNLERACLGEFAQQTEIAKQLDAKKCSVEEFTDYISNAVEQYLENNPKKASLHEKFLRWILEFLLEGAQYVPKKNSTKSINTTKYEELL